jgi:translation initiation factor IF-2
MAESKRIYEVAKDYKISSEALLSILRDLGFKVKSHMSVADEKMLLAIQEKFEKEKAEVKKDYEIRKQKLEERGKKEELYQRVEKIKARLKTKDLEIKRKEVPQLEKIKPRRAKFKKARRFVDAKEVEESVKKTLAQIDSLKKVKKYKRRTKESGEIVEELENAIQVSEFASVSELASLMELKPAEIIAKCLELGFVASINQRLDMDTIHTIALEFGFNVEEVKEVGMEEEEIPEEEQNLKPRAPVITIMGHVDHGKTSLLDHIRKSNIIAGEFGGITQHIGAYEVILPGGNITFLDTPGHQAFTAMRARGVQVTDIVVLVVAADDGVMPQTVEAIDHAKAAGVPIIVAINKMDLPGANSEPIKRQLANYGLLPEEWGGKTIMIEISAKTGLGVQKLLEMILLQAEMMELKANPDRLPQGIVIESRLDRGRGAIATVLIQKGTLRIGDSFVTGLYSGKVRAMLDERGKNLAQAGPSTPVQILGSSGVPQVGDSFRATETDQEAKEISAKRLRLQREKEFRKIKRFTLKEVKDQITEGKVKELNLIIKGDVVGSIEALSDTLEKISTPELRVNVLHKSTGAINESDVLLAAASQAVIIGFHVRPDLRAREIAQREKVDIRLHTIIYEVEKEIKAALEGMLEPEIKENVTGVVEIREVFKVSKIGQVGGGMVQQGVVKRGDKVRVIRDGLVIYDGIISSLKRFKEDVKEVSSGFECGLKIENYEDLKTADTIEAYEQIEVAKKLEGT